MAPSNSLYSQNLGGGLSRLLIERRVNPSLNSVAPHRESDLLPFARCWSPPLSYYSPPLDNPLNRWVYVP